MEQFTRSALAHLNFEEIQTAMGALQWHWGNESEPPSIEDMQQVVSRLIQDLGHCVWAETGGFAASRDERGHLRIEFRIATHDNMDL